MDQFMKLPPAQKAAVLAAVLAVLGVGMYFLLVDPELARGDQQREVLSKLDRDIAGMGGDITLEEMERLRKLKDELIEADKENRKMLPSADEIPDFIDAVQQDARAVGLRVNRFDRLEMEPDDLYNSIPIKMSVQGSMLDLIQFLRVYAGPERRVINIRDLVIENMSPDFTALRAQWLASKPLDVAAKPGAMTATRTPEEQLLEQIEIMEMARKEAKIRATFTAYAFTWTGKPMQRAENAPAAKKAKKKRT